MHKGIEKCLSKYNNIIGKQFNSLKVLSIHSQTKNGQYNLLCKCNCGNIKPIRASRVINGITKTCGCRNRGYNYCTPNKLSRKYPNLYSIWNTMKHRCYNPKHHKYINYGSRGIKVCKEWEKQFEPFLNWAINNGYQKGLTIDRIDVNGNYEPSNCRWVTHTIQARNKTNNRIVEYKGSKKCLAQWCDELKIPYDTVRARIYLGWTIDKAFETPTSRSNKYKKLLTTQNMT